MQYKTIYLSGPMNGYPDHNFAAFAEAREDLRDRGLKVVCPAEAGQVEGWTWEQYLRRDLILMLLDCDALVALPGWEASKGANLEIYVAQRIGMPTWTLESVQKVF